MRHFHQTLPWVRSEGAKNYELSMWLSTVLSKGGQWQHRAVNTDTDLPLRERNGPRLLWSSTLEEEWRSTENNWNPRRSFLSPPARYLVADSIGTTQHSAATLQALQRRDRSKRGSTEIRKTDRQKRKWASKKQDLVSVKTEEKCACLCIHVYHSQAFKLHMFHGRRDSSGPTTNTIIVRKAVRVHC